MLISHYTTHSLIPKTMYTNLFITTSILLLILQNNINATITSTIKEPGSGQIVRLQHGSNSNGSTGSKDVASPNCLKLYKETAPPLTRLVSGKDGDLDDTLTAAKSRRSCADGLKVEGKMVKNLKNFTSQMDKGGIKIRQRVKKTGLLGSWDPRKDEADFYVAQDGSGNYKTINEVVQAIFQIRLNRTGRLIIYVKSGVYRENVDIMPEMNNLMFVGDGIQNTIITASRSVGGGSTTADSATFSVYADGFWARDITFENAAGPDKYQAVALSVAADKIIFYRCSIKGYQDTLFAAVLRQLYQDCKIYGTIDFIFGNATAVFNNCDIYVRRPLDHQFNTITAHGRRRSSQTTGFSIVKSRIKPAPEFKPVKNQFKSYLGRPWGKYSRTVVLNSDIDELIHPEGWSEWNGNIGMSTLYYGEYRNSGKGSSTAGRVHWPGFHVITDPEQAELFTASRFLHGDSWIPVSGIPYSDGIF